jgi:hypothetical protein
MLLQLLSVLLAAALCSSWQLMQGWDGGWGWWLRTGTWTIMLMVTIGNTAYHC